MASNSKTGKIEKLFIHIIKRDDNDFELAGLSENKELWYNLPDECRDLNLHKILSSKQAVKSAITAIKPINGYRKIGVKLDNDLRKEYFDEDDNLCFLKIPLEESNVDLETGGYVVNKSEGEIFLLERIKELETKLNLNDEVKLHEVEKKFILDKFNKKQNPTDWLERFENECRRHKVNSATNMIEILRFFVSGSPKDWYEVNLIKIGLFNWFEWKKSFLTVFIDKGWSKIRVAYNYKYLGGSLIDYALAKEGLCLEVEKNATVMSRINMIAVGLPLEIQNQLDREEITTIEKLFIELRKFDDYFSKPKSRNDDKSLNKGILIKSNINVSKKNIDTKTKKPCFMCEELGWKNRYHPTNECRNKNLYSSKKEVNIHDKVIHRTKKLK